MRKTSVLLTLLLFVGCLLSGCNDNGGSVKPYAVSLLTEAVVEEKMFELDKNKTVCIDFDVPETGYIKLLAFDATEYIEWPDEITELYVDFKDANGKLLYENICITNGYLENYKFESGRVTAEISAENAPFKMNRIALSWAFAPDNYEPVELDFEYESAALADENGVARFSLNVEKPSLVRIFPSEACIYESNCSFYVETADGERVTGDLSILGTEWASRLAFLGKGEYTVVVSEIEGVASCRARIEKSYNNIYLDDAEGITVPAVFGLNNLNMGSRSVGFTADGSKKYLVVDAKGTGTFYDSVQYVSVVITDANGNVVAQSDDDELVSDETVIDISALRGDYTATVTVDGSCVLEVSLINR